MTTTVSDLPLLNAGKSFVPVVCDKSLKGGVYDSAPTPSPSRTHRCGREGLLVLPTATYEHRRLYELPTHASLQ